ncbi:hypothetical protein TERTU_1690 [Teredinibacter turnerae T7901]|uniref:Bacterial Ig-like domain-containing protein n=1 Tax=Teredinibacter turnerae (strain ATCC 39867 / T7901) TaxID=377629 RepID=C5BU32_TERTT|nr:hypothetical protein [Teredinibacter turnerae]ACR14528.1 hypothetical protein TERTU_1690 [Teredinibacter turnerae T7901]
MAPTPTITPTPFPPTPVPDTSPEAFTFTLEQSTYARSAEVLTNTVTIAGINTQAPLVVSAGAEYSIASGDFTAGNTTIANGQTLQIKTQAGAEFSDEVAITVSVGDYETSFTVVTVPQDITPEPFSFAPKTDVDLAMAYTASATITGINDAAPISVSNGEYAIGDGDFTSAAGTIESGETVTVKVLSSTNFSTETAAVLDIGGVKGTLAVTTLAQDIEPDAFSFESVMDADLNTVYSADAITISGINDAAPIVVADGEYAINDQPFTSEEGTVQAGDNVVLRLTSAATANTVAMATLTIGGIANSFSVTTVKDLQAPTAKIAFPPPTAKTANTSVMVRGSAEDNLSQITDLKIFVNGQDSGATIESTDNFATWKTQLDLFEGDNAITIVVTDEAGNVNTEAASVNMRREDYDLEFPHEGVEFNLSRTVVLDDTVDSPRLLIGRRSIDGKIMSIDPSTGVRTELTVKGLPTNLTVTESMTLDKETNALYVLSTAPGDQIIYRVDLASLEVTHFLSLADKLTAPDKISLRRMLVDRETQDHPRILIAMVFENAIGSVDLDLTEFSIFSSNTIPNTALPFDEPTDIKLVPGTRRLLATNLANGQILEIDPDTGTRNLFVDATASTETSSWASATAIAFDVYHGRNRAIVTGYENNDTLLAVNLESRVTELFSGLDLNNRFDENKAIMIHPNYEFAFVFDNTENAIFAVDLVTGQRVVISKSN